MAEAIASQALVFEIDGDSAVAILQAPVSIDRASLRVAVLIVVGGPQYRVGSHRQFVLLARDLAQRGFGVMRFDHRGVGDSGGSTRSFEAIGEDIATALRVLRSQWPAVTEVVTVGLCDGAAAALLSCAEGAKHEGLVLINPWIRTESSEAGAYVRHYYGARLLQLEFWRKLLRGEVELIASLRDFVRKLVRSRSASASVVRAPFRERMLTALQRFPGDMLIVTSGRDLVAREFDDLCKQNREWGLAVGRDNVTTRALPEADHTFSSRAELDAANRLIGDWIEQLWPPRAVRRGDGEPSRAS